MVFCAETGTQLYILMLSVPVMGKYTRPYQPPARKKCTVSGCDRKWAVGAIPVKEQSNPLHQIDGSIGKCDNLLWKSFTKWGFCELLTIVSISPETN